MEWKETTITEPKVKRIRSIDKRLEQLRESVALKMKVNESCGEGDPSGKWVCNRKSGHYNQHVAISDDVLAVWRGNRSNNWEG